MHIIDFFGAPGSGKTYQANHIKSMLEDNNVIVNSGFLNFCNKNKYHRIGLKIFYFLYGILSRFSLFLKLVRFTSMHKESGLNRKVSIIFNIFFTVGFLLKKKSSILVLDQGIVQLLFQMYIKDTSLSILKYFFESLKIKKYDLFIINTSKKLRETRLLNRYKDESLGQEVAISMNWNEEKAIRYLNDIQDLGICVSIHYITNETEIYFNSICNSIK